jgi:hypothetical protein
MDATSFQSHVGYSAGAAKTARTVTGARTVLAILVTSGLLGSADGKIVPLEPEPPSAGPTPEPELSTLRSSFEQKLASPRYSSDFDVVTDRQSRLVSVNVELRISATPAELDGLGVRIRALLDDLRTDAGVREDVEEG